MGGGLASGLEHFSAADGGDEAEKRDFDAWAFHRALTAWCQPHHLECSAPFLVSWYNEKRWETAKGTQSIEAPPAAVAFALISVPGYLDVVVDHFRGARPSENFVDATTNDILERLRRTLQPDLAALVVNTDVGPPYYHVQTIGDVAGLDQHVEAKDFQGPEADVWREDLSSKLEETRDPKMWGSDPAELRNIFGVNVHPVWGGWYAYRALVVLRGALAPGLVRPPPQRFLDPEQARRIIREYNLRHQLCLWRDLAEDGHPPDRRYTTDEYLFFTESSPEKRRRWLELRASQLDQAQPWSRTPCLARLIA